jgi:glycosyltransferase involved in cell wall biosynthesis
MRQAGVYVLCSRHEAYPIALCEALAAGCCIVAVDCPTGPREIFASAGGDVGLLISAGDSRVLADELERVMADPSLRERLGQAAQRCSPQFGPVEVMKRWDKFLKSAAVASA